MSNLEGMINKLVITIVCVQSVLSSIMAGLHMWWQTNDNVFDDIHIEPFYSEKVYSIISFFTYFLLLNTLLPISL
jgi:magnesium-transporting ATPase (P-type)